MGSPFKSADEYMNATGLLHSFTNSPTLATIVLIVAVVLTLYFLYAAFTIRH